MTRKPADESAPKGTDETAPSDPESGDATVAPAYFETPETTTGTTDTSGVSITHMDDYPSYEIAEGLFFRPVFAENLSLNFVTFPPHSGFPSHGHPEEQISIIREGEMEFTIGDIIQRVGPGDVIVFPPNVVHEGRTFDVPCRVIDIFSPSRTGIKEVIASADPVRSADVDRWWSTNDSN